MVMQVNNVYTIHARVLALVTFCLPEEESEILYLNLSEKVTEATFWLDWSQG
jgi:hypothetical protein